MARKETVIQFGEGGFLRGFAAVSYTHLDVYKRQANACARRQIHTFIPGMAGKRGGSSHDQNRAWETCLLQCSHC